MHLNGTFGTIQGRNMAGDGTFLIWKSKQHAKLYVRLVFQVPLLDFFSHENTLENPLIKFP